MKRGDRVCVCRPKKWGPLIVSQDFPTGKIDSIEPDGEHYLVELDEPAIYLHADGRRETLPIIREAVDNVHELNDC